MKVLVACEYSGMVREAFAARGHYALSCDFEPTEQPGNHYQGDVRDVLDAEDWDLMIGHPPCTYMEAMAEQWGDLERPAMAVQERLEFAL